MKQIRAERHRGQRGRPWREVLPPDPRDRDIVRAKALARSKASPADDRPCRHGPRYPDASDLMVTACAVRGKAAAAGSPGEEHASVRDGRTHPPARARTSQTGRAVRPAINGRSAREPHLASSTQCPNRPFVPNLSARFAVSESKQVVRVPDGHPADQGQLAHTGKESS